MAEQAPMLSSGTSTLGGLRYTFQLRGVPPAFANAIRRILLNEMPVVEVGNIEIHENTSLMPHEMLTLRTQLLPVNVRPTEEDVIRSAKISVRYYPSEEVRQITTDDFIVTGARSDILMKDPVLNTPLYFMKLKAGEALHVTASLRVNPLSSHVCVATYANHVDEEKAEEDKAIYMQENPSAEAERIFDTFYRQRSFLKNPKTHLPDWFDMTVESIGVVPARDLLKDAIKQLKEAVLKWASSDIIRESEENVYRVDVTSGGHTVGNLVQAIMYASGLTTFVSYDVPHPLRTDMRVRFRAEVPAEEVIAHVKTTITAMCDTCVGLI